MDIRNQKRFVPVFLWTLFCSGVFVLALYQEKSSDVILPFLSLSNAFGWIASLLLLYLVLVWSMSLNGLIERYARQPLSQGLYALNAVQEPFLLVLYTLPILILSASFGFKGFTAMTQAILVVAAVGMVTWAHFRLGFFFHGSLAKPYYFTAGILCFLIPLLNVVFESLYEKGPSWLNYMNPFYVLLNVTGPGEGIRFAFVVFFVTFAGVAIVLLAVPFVMAMPPRLYKDLPG
jgi:hypothetical protein